MKKHILALTIALALAHEASAQIEVTSGGNVGIGTTTPGTKLEVNGAAAFNGWIGGTGAAGSALSIFGSKNDVWGKDLTIKDGNLGVGTNSPGGKLDVRADGTVLYAYLKSYSGTAWQAPRIATYRYRGSQASPAAVSAGDELFSLEVSGRNPNGADVYAGGLGFYATGAVSGNNVPTYLTFSTNSTNSAAERMRIDSAGNVGIGTSTPGYKLEVAGSVRATSFISNSTTYADFVFEPEYRLAPLSEVEAHIKAKGHLPDIPSAAEAQAQGIDLAALQVKLLQKVEELTLHAIAHDRALSALKAENTALRRELTELRNR
jgi:hypothetical protein